MIEFVAETGSTNADLVARLRAGEALAEGHWLVADRQSEGRGRQGRVWSDGAGNFMGSTIIRLQAGDPPPASLSFVAALAVQATLVPLLDARKRVELKWPNDVLLNRAKVAGILLELFGDAVVLGIGVNLASAPDLSDRPVTSLRAHGVIADRDVFAHNLDLNLASELALWRECGRGQGIKPVLDRFLALSAHQPGTLTTVHDGHGGKIAGSFAGLAPDDGALCLRLDDGKEQIVRSGDVILPGN